MPLVLDGDTGIVGVLLTDSNGNVTFDTNTLYVDAPNNRVGIGTTAPNYPLEVEATATTSTDIVGFSNSNGTAKHIFGLENVGAGTYRLLDSSNNNAVFFSGHNADKSYLNVGDFGIGTTNPVAPLVISNGGASGIEFHPEIASNFNRITNYNRSSSAYNNLGIDALEINLRPSGVRKFTVNASETVVNPDSQVHNFRVSSDTNANMIFVDGTNNRVGIGTNSPDTQLEISSPYNTTLRLSSTRNSNAWVVGDSVARIEMYSEDGTWPTASVRSSIDAVVENTSGNGVGLAFKTLNNAERMRITNDGNVGIGTTLPQAKLHINSNDGMIIPVGTEAQRQSTPSAGTIRFNSSSASFEGYNGSTWVTLSGDFVNTKSIKFALGSYVDLAGGLNLGTGTWTASFWIKPTQNNLAYQEYFSALGSTIISNGQYLLGANNTFVNAWSNYATSTFPLTVNEWYNIVYVRPSAASSGSGSLLLYINGELNKSGSTSGSSGIQTYANLKLGSDNSGEHSSVYMDEVALWDAALSASAIKDIYNDGSPSDLMSTVGNYSSASDLIGYWRFSEGTGTTVADLSGNSYDGTLNGSVSWSDQTPETNWSQITDIFADGSCKAHYLLDNNGYDKSVNGNTATSFVTGSGTYSTSIKAFGTHSFSTSSSTMDLPDVVTSYPFTVSAWVYKSNWTATGTQNHLVMNAAINGNQRISLCHVDWNNNGGYEWSIMYGGTNHWTFAPGSMNNGQWYHVVFSVHSSNSTQHAVYLNGTALSATNRGGGHGGTAGWALGGNFDGSENFDGQISNVRVFNRQLSAAEAMSLYSKENLNLYP